MRFSRFARVRALFTAMLNSQVLSDDRPSKRPMPAMTAAQVSYATSPATESLRT
jgi:hypothetical protein